MAKTRCDVCGKHRPGEMYQYVNKGKTKLRTRCKKHLKEKP